MDDFNKLTLNSHDDVLQESDLIAISQLTITDKKVNMLVNPEEYKNKFMPHFPISPSPLRQHFISMDSDEMDIDNPLIGKEHTCIDNKQAQNSRLTCSSLLEDNELLENNPEDEDTSSPKKSLSISDTSMVIKSLLSPTSLGVETAMKMDEIPQVSNPDDTIKQSPSITSSSVGNQALENELRSRMKDHPIQVQVNNHHHHYYYHPSSDNNYNTVDHDPYVLPAPWSSKSKPVLKHSYVFTSYLQIALNGLTLLTIISFLSSLIGALRQDLKSTWNHTKSELEFESLICKNHYNVNHCSLETRLPALENQCIEWEKCMSRNNDIFFRARSILSAKLFGDIINSFIEPLGWKALVSILLGLGIWCFSSNFLLGFARAKSYYGNDLNRDRKRIENDCSDQKQDMNSNSLVK